MRSAAPSDGAGPGRIAVIGTGTIGAAMTRNLAAAGFAVSAWNRTAERAQELERFGVSPRPTPAAAVDGARWVITALTSGDVVEQAMSGALASMGSDAVWIQTSTVGVVAIERLRRLADEHGVAFVDAPVLGSKQPAEEGQLVVLAAGDPRLDVECRPVFDAVAGQVRWVGDEPGAGTRLKLVANCWLLAVTEAVAESVAFAEAVGIDPRLFLDTIGGSQIDTPYLHIKAAAILERRLEPNFRLALARKDIALVQEAAERAGIDVRLAATIQERFERATALGHGDDDMAATYYASTVTAPAR